MFAVSKAAQKNKNPTMEDWVNIKRILKYLKYTINFGIKFSKDRQLKVFVDADFAGDIQIRKSISGFLMKIGTAPTSWYSKLQKCVATSIEEAEYYSVSDCAKHNLWYLNVLNNLNINIIFVIINIGNKATIYNCQNQSINPRSKYIDIKYYYVRSLIKENKIKLKYIKSEENTADGFTKYLNISLMNKFRNALLVEMKDY